jgi:putative addiction module component (TIGR02574 family)
MSSTEILKEALQLKPQERYLVIENLLKSLDIPDETIDKVWAEEAQKRLQDYRQHRTETIPFDQIFDK